MNRRIVFACVGPPDWGDANTWAYGLFARLRGGPFDATFVSLLGDADEFYFRYLRGADFDNPRRLDSVVSCRIDEAGGSRDQPALASLLRSLAPDLIVAWGGAAARLLAPAAEGVPLVLMLTECDSVERFVGGDYVRDWMHYRAALDRGVAFPFEFEARERDAFEAADLVVGVSSVATAGFERLLPSISGRIYERRVTPADLSYEEAERHGDRRRAFAERDIDVLFSAADWTRPAANLRAVEQIAAALAGRQVHVAGEIDRSVAGARTHGALRSRDDHYALLGRAKVVVAPALAAGGPSLLFEAAAMGCNVVASPNCGYAALCNDALLAPRGSAREFLERIRPALLRPYVENRDPFPGGTADLVETLAVV
jgi:hypothetical protein